MLRITFNMLNYNVATTVIYLDLDQPDRSSCFCYQNAMLEILHTRLHAYTLTRLQACTHVHDED